MPTTSLGFRYPSGTDYAGTGPDVPRAVSELAADLNAYLSGKYKLVAITNIFQGTTSYTPTSGVDGLYVEMVGAGGGGGGAATGITNGAAGGGGGGGGYAALFTNTIKTFTVQVGAGGTGVSGNNGNNGTASTFDSPSICTANGGQGGVVHTVTTPPVIGGAGGAGGGASLGDLLVSGQTGGCGITLAAAQILGGAGGTSHWGGGASQLKNLTSAGATGGIYGSGGGGAGIISGGASQAGGNGANGLIRVWEFQKS